ncbi:thioredoxin family protein [Lacihabitans sp. LS3-19]|uniref:thioredoxin family protein n=1 Tax=Lacihabitans sp. LS3-19 TaxID=2487335 RepID=UPI0020CD6338|nr:thioredoxin family protein [Lacihabitans sp. LS3-19]MCP9767928.1 thioredoxin family protein [Lacihabitans sp. LS3-19]
MKNLTFILVLFFGFYAKSSGQIKWQKDFDVARNIAFKTGKKVVVECFHPECSHCKLLNANLQNETVAQYFNENYTCFKIDLSNQEEVKLLESKHIRLTNYPVFLFFDNDGNFQYFIEPKEKPQDILIQFEEERGNSCVDCEKAENASIKDNVKCATYYRLLKDYEKSEAICNKFFRELPESEKSSQDAWNVFKKVVLSPNNDFFAYWINNQNLAAQYEGNTGKEKDSFVTVIQQRAKYLETLEEFPGWEVDSLDSYLTKMGADEKMKSVWLWSLRMSYYLNSKDYNSVKNFSNKMVEFYPDASTYGFLSEKVNSKVSGNEMHAYFLEIKDKWFAGIKEPKQKLQFFKQSALFYGKNGDKAMCNSSIAEAEKLIDDKSELKAIREKYCR